jgi:hypothetical protein
MGGSRALAQGWPLIAGQSTRTLGVLTISPTNAVIGQAYSGTISGAAPGSTITLDSLTVTGTGTTRTVTGTPTGSPGSWPAVETLVGAVGSPRTTFDLLAVTANTGLSAQRHVTSGGSVNTASENRPASSPRDTRLFYMRYVVQGDTAYIQPGYHGWRIQALNAQPEVANASNVTIDAVAAQLGDLTAPTATAPLTFDGGSRSGVVQGGVFLKTHDRLNASAFGKAKFVKGDVIWIKGTYRLAEGAGAYTFGQTMRPFAGVNVICCSANYADAVAQVDTVGPFRAPTTYNDGTTNWTAQSLPVMQPNIVLGEWLSPATRSLITFSDSIGYRVGDFSGDGQVGGGWCKRGAFSAGVANYTCAIGGYATYHYANINTYQRQLWQYFDTLLLAQGTNDISNGQTLQQIKDNRTLVRGHFTTAQNGGRATVLESTVWPRISAGQTYNGNTVYRATDLVNQTLYNTQAVDGGGTRTGLGYEAGGTKDQLNAFIRANAQIVVDVSPLGEASGDTTKWAVQTFSTTLKSAASALAGSVVLTDSPPIGTSLVLEPGGATTAVDPKGQYTQTEVNAAAGNTTAFNVIAVTGNATSGYTVNFYPTTTDASAGGVGAVTPALNFAHATGAVVKATYSQDETHPTMPVHVAAGALLAQKLAALPT